MTRSSPILYWVLGLLVVCAGFGFYNGFHTATHRDTPSWAGGSTLSPRPGAAAPAGYEPPEAQPLAADNPAGVTPVQTAPAADKPKPKDEDADKPEADDTTTATAVGEPKPVTLPTPTGEKPAATDKAKPPAGSTAAKAKPAPAAPTPPAAEAPPPAQQPAVPY